MTIKCHIKCPICKKRTVYSEKNPYRPFCSERCQLIDLGQWIEGDYRIPTDDSSASQDKEER